MSIISSLLSWYFRKRWPEIEYNMLNADEVQERTLLSLLSQAKYTEIGNLYSFKQLNGYHDYQQQVPIGDYEQFKPYIERNMRGEQNLLWPSDIKWFAKSSGTTSDKSKFIPVSFESLENCHYQGGRDVLATYCNHFPNTEIFSGKGLVIGGSHKVNNWNENSFYGDLSAVMMSNIPFWVDFLRTPDKKIALMDEWESKLEQMANATLHEDVTNLSGVPTWTIVLIEKLFEKTGKSDLLEIWPNLELYIHGGVSFLPYRHRFNQLIKRSKIQYLETYNASEGFFGLQDDLSRDDLLLMTSYGVFYEFVKPEEAHQPFPKVFPLWEVETDVNYAMVITTNGGLWRYLIGDTIRFTSKRPYRFKITGRTKLFINAFGEELVIENAENAIATACAETNAIVSDYTAAPRYMQANQDAGHEWLIEFEVPPNNFQRFCQMLDDRLKAINSDYEAKRYKDIALKPPLIQTIPKGTFNEWLKVRGKLGGQHKVPRLANHRDFVDELLTFVNRL